MLSTLLWPLKMLRAFFVALGRRLSGASVPLMLRLLVALPVTIFLLSGMINYFAVQRLSRVVQPVIDEELPATVYESMMVGAFHKSISGLLATNQNSLSRNEREARLKNAQENFDYYVARLESYSELKRTETAEESFQLLWNSRGEMKQAFDEIMAVARKVDVDPENSKKMTQVYESKLRPIAKVVEGALEDLAGLHIYAVKSTQKTVEAVDHRTRLQIVLMGLFGVLAVTILGFIIFRQTLRVLTGLARRLESAFTELASSSLELNRASQRLSSGSADASVSIELTAKSLGEIDQMIGRTLSSTLESGGVSEGSRNAANSGAEAVKSVIEGIGLIHDSSLRLADFEAMFAEIQVQTRQIDRIVFKTQILCFNASIEAVRAGSHGSGFKFVASEIGELAKTSLAASAQISDLITQSSKRVQRVVSEIRERVDEGQAKANLLTDSFSSVLKNVNQVNQSLSQIGEASGEQATGISRISKSTNELKGLIMDNSMVSAKVAETSNRLNEQADRFQSELATLSSAIGEGRARRLSA